MVYECSNMYADDIIVSTSESGLQIGLRNFTVIWQLKVNITKSKEMVFNKTGKMCHRPTAFK